MFKDNPFRIGPAISSEEIIWVGFADLKSKIEDKIKFSIKTSSSRIVLNWGRYGSGKTHAANFYSRTNALGKICQDNKTKGAQSICITLPRTSKDPVQAFFRSFLGKKDIQQVKSDIIKLKDFLGQGFQNVLENLSSDTVITKLFNIILNTKDEDLDEIEQYLFGDSTKGILSKLGMPFGIKDDEQIVNFLSTYINLITYKKEVYSSYIIWLDEFEDIDNLNQSSQNRFTTFLRQFFDKTPNNLLLFINFTPKTFYNIEDLSITLGEALTTRAKPTIEFDIPNPKEAKIYLDELINHEQYRLKKTSNQFFPFTDETIDYILENIGVLSVRKINEVFSILLEIALVYEENTLDKSFVDKYKDQIISWEE